MKFGKIFLRVFLSFGLIALLIYLMRNDLGKIIRALLNARLSIFLLVFVLYIITLTIASYRLKWVMHVQKTHLKISEAVYLNFVGHFFNQLLPTSFGGDVVKAYYLSRKTKNKLGSFTAVFADRFLGLITIVFIASFALIFLKGPFYPKVRLAIIFILLFSIAASLFLLNRKLAKKFFFLKAILKFLKLDKKTETIYNALNIYKHHRGVIIKSLILSLAVQSFSFYLIYLLSKALYIAIPLKLVFFVMPLVSFASMLPSIGGLGFREGAFIIFFVPFMTRDQAFALSLLWDGVLILISILGGILYAFKGGFKVKIEPHEDFSVT